MKNCPNCGAPLQPGVKFCTKCGAKIPESNQGEGSVQMDPANTSKMEPTKKEPNPVQLDPKENKSGSDNKPEPQPEHNTSIPNGGSNQQNLSTSNGPINPSGVPNQSMPQNMGPAQNNQPQMNQNVDPNINPNMQPNMGPMPTPNGQPQMNQGQNMSPNMQPNMGPTQNGPMPNNQMPGNQMPNNQPFQNQPQMNPNMNPNFQQQMNPNQSVSGNSGVHKDSFSNYFIWYKNSLIHPSEVSNENNFFGLISLLLNSLLVALALYVTGSRIFGAALEALSEVQDYVESSGSSASSTIQKMVPSGIMLYLKLLLLVLVFNAVYLLIGFLTKRYFINDKSGAFSYFNQIASYSNSMLILDVLLIVLMFALTPKNLENFISAEQNQSYTFMTVLILMLAFITIIWTVSFLASIIVTDVKMRIDRIYVAIIAFIVVTIILALIGRFIGNSLMHSISNQSIGQNIISGIIA
ncbi:zinc ribbon domain-containing protein [Companilactobacillus mishanensis]|uniref:zinc ribbon domain-containing protein n=1 Tax=Companilactobacillus mishanensis TaxID=2486008 RepID=UPI0012982299|nr:zinc ribbon domain-containing protein [Companilactobacillus mishanensis]MQS89671.1 zinc-ribbon domain-containing protein [Companilactobacillus mishanensis]